MRSSGIEWPGGSTRNSAAACAQEASEPGTCVPGGLPILPESVAVLQSLRRASPIDLNEIVRAVRQDPGLLANILRILARLTGQRTNLYEAIIDIGVEGLRRLGFFMCCEPTQMNHVRAIARNSVFVAAACEQVALECGFLDSELAHSAGLLHDIGKLRFISACEVANTELWTSIEKQVYGAIGGELARVWGFPDELTEAIGLHANEHARKGHVLPTLVALAVRSNDCCAPGCATELDVETHALVRECALLTGVTPDRILELIRVAHSNWCLQTGTEVQV